MKTEHKIILGDARSMKELKDESIDLMITSPPYPMIQMWDEMFGKQNPEITRALKEEDGKKAFELMHKELDKVWDEIFRVLKNGGIACINIGDATRTIKDIFQIYTSHARILNHCINLGFHALPEILWIKETNKPDKFMGSGMLPVGAYVTLEHEHILILRKDGKRKFIKQEQKENRQKSAFFWEERNIWFSDRWKDINGVFQKLNNIKLRERSAAYPPELTYRLISMFSVQGDIVLDPFLGTGTTTLGAIVCGRNSVGYEIDSNFKEHIDNKLEQIKDPANEFINLRLRKHEEFVKQREQEKGKLKYINQNYNFPVMTRQEINLHFPKIKNIKKLKENLFEVEHLF
ncbi:site-specific DNA-methyltransferase [Candidatus Pacearchaeota archaeon]|nr:site-specific DNA-methyltransferase [Candidatus Pacearchaeota archaeon]